LLLPVVQQRVDIPSLMQRAFGAVEFKGTLTFCPFHDNTETPALSVFADGARFKCHGCGKRGDVIDFFRLCYRKKVGRELPFRSAVLALAKHAGIAVDGETTAEVLATVATALRTDPKARKNATKRHMIDKARRLVNPLILTIRNLPGGGFLACQLGEELDSLLARSETVGYQRLWGEVLRIASRCSRYIRDSDCLLSMDLPLDTRKPFW